MCVVHAGKGLAGMTKTVLHRELAKDHHVRCGNWSCAYSRTFMQLRDEDVLVLCIPTRIYAVES